MNKDFKSCVWEWQKINMQIETLTKKKDKSELDNEMLNWYIDAEKFYLRRIKRILKDFED